MSCLNCNHLAIDHPGKDGATGRCAWPRCSCCEFLPPPAPRLYSTEEVVAAWESAKATWHEVRIAGGSGDMAWETAEAALHDALEAIRSTEAA